MELEDFTEEDIEVAVELGELVREESRKEASEFIRSLFEED